MVLSKTSIKMQNQGIEREETLQLSPRQDNTEFREERFMGQAPSWAARLSCESSSFFLPAAYGLLNLKQKRADVPMAMARFFFFPRAGPMLRFFFF